jgi:hypothetical protein
MTNDTERNFDHKQSNPNDKADQYKKNPSHESGQHLPNQQDPSKKNPMQTDDSRQRDGQGSEQPEKRRA